MIACAFFCILLATPLSKNIGWLIINCICIAITTPGAWIGLIGTIARWIPHHRQGRIMSLILAEYLLIDSLSIILIKDLFILYLDMYWKYILIILSSICILFNIPALLFLKKSPKSLQFDEPPPRSALNTKLTASRPRGLKQLIWPLIKKRTFWLMAALAFEIYGIRQFFLIYSWHWILSSYCNFTYSVSSPFSHCLTDEYSILLAILISLLFPFAGIFSTLFIGYLKDGLPRKHRSSLLFTLLVAFCIFLLIILLVERFLNNYLPLVIMLVFFSGFTLLPAYSLIAGAFALELGGKYRSATSSSFIDTAGTLFPFFFFFPFLPFIPPPSLSFLFLLLSLLPFSFLPTLSIYFFLILPFSMNLLRASFPSLVCNYLALLTLYSAWDK